MRFCHMNAMDKQSVNGMPNGTNGLTLSYSFFP